MAKEMKDPMLLLVLSACSILIFYGCYSSARHIANVRPEVVKPDATLTVKYRLEHIILKKSDFSRKVIDGNEDVLKEDKKSGPNGTHYADTQMIFNSVHTALLKDYPSVFTDSADAIPIVVVIDWATEYREQPDYASIFSGWFWPNAAEQETIYYLYLVENPLGKTDDELWSAYLAAPKKYPLPQECGSAVRMSEVWESFLLPTGFIPCPGESDFPKTYCFMRSGKDSLVRNPVTKIQSRQCVQDMVFEPKVDGEVLAAAVMRIVNRKHRTQEAKRMLEGGAR